MVAEQEQLIKELSMGANDRVLEIMSDEGEFISLFIDNVDEVETIEVDPGLTYLTSWKEFQSNVHNHFVFCGHPYYFLKKKIEDHAEVDIIIVNADRMDRSREIWGLIGILEPRWVILTYTELKVGEHNKRLMEACGFKIMKQEVDLNNGIFKKFCVGCSSKCYSD